MSEEALSVGEDTLQAMRRAILRVSLAADGLDGILDQQLVALRDAVRQDIDARELNALVEDIAKTVLRLEERRQQPQGIPQLPQLLERIGEHRPKLRRELERLLLRAEREGDGVWLDALELLDRALAQEGSWWNRVWQGPKPQPEPTEPSPELPTEVRETLQGLLQRLTIPTPLAAQAAAISRKLRQALSLGALPPLLEEITGLVLDTSREETQEIESFLQQLTDRLCDIQSFLEHSSSDQQTAREHRRALDQALHEGVSNLHDHMQSARDLGELKRAVTQQLDTLLTRVAEFQKGQETLAGAAEERIEDLSRRLQETEKESDQLRRRLLQQQMRAQQDRVTGVPNREGYQHRLAYEVARWQRYSAPLCLVVADIDRFKAFNDRFGHSTGDKVLRTVAQTLQSNLRSTDFLARYGGEEFVILMPETPLKQATHAADKLRQALEAQPFHAGEERIRLTVSFGVTEFVHGDDGESAFDRADKALYEAKDGGRNQVVASRAAPAL